MRWFWRLMPGDRGDDEACIDALIRTRGAWDATARQPKWRPGMERADGASRDRTMAQHRTIESKLSEQRRRLEAPLIHAVMPFQSRRETGTR